MSAGTPTSFAAAEEALHEEARQSVGYDDFGDPAYLDGLRVLLRAYDEEARFNQSGRPAARSMLVETLCKRLRCNQMLAARPDILQTRIERPLVICGLIRTGSTALHYLLGRDPDLQCLQYWLAGNPAPRPPRETWPSHPHFLAAKAEIDGMYEQDPSLQAIHFMMPDGPEECRHLLAQTFTDDGFEVNAHVPSYSEWYEHTDMRPAYRRHLDLVKLIGSTDLEHTWLLKYPVHMRNLDALLEVYPDACVIQTHRDPTAVLPSYISLIAGFRALFEDDIDRPEIARRQLELWARGAEKAIASRERHQRQGGDPAQFYDFFFADFMRDPIGEVKRMYAHFGRSLSAAGETALRAWQSDNPQHKHGKHTYSRAAEDVGLTRSEILDRFAGYMDHHGMQPE